MKKLLALALLLLQFTLHSHSQSVFGYWYGDANVKTKSSANNYMVELVLMPEKNYVKGVLNYYFKNTYRSFKVKGNYNAATRQLSLYNIPVVYHASRSSMEVDCMMNMQATLRVAMVGSDLVGSFIGLPDYQNMCADINFNLRLNADISKVDSVLKTFSEYKESIQVWTPSEEDTLVAANIIQRKVINYVIEKEYTQRENVLNTEINVGSDSLKVDFYDNGEIDGDSVSFFFNNKLIAFHQKLGSRSIHFDIVLDSAVTTNEITMFAENLGSIPPNTALMVVDDGHDRYNIRLSSSLEKNATIRIKRRGRK